MQAAVADAVVCGWIQEWVDANEAGDSEAHDAAVEAMASSREWPPLAAHDGASYIWEVADAMVADTPLAQYEGLSLPQGTGYQRHVGCPGG